MRQSDGIILNPFERPQIQEASLYKVQLSDYLKTPIKIGPSFDRLV